MTVLLNAGRALMAVWVLYGLALIFVPQYIHRAPDQKSGIIQVLVAYLLGYLLDRILASVRRRRAALAAEAEGGIGS